MVFSFIITICNMFPSRVSGEGAWLLRPAQHCTALWPHFSLGPALRSPRPRVTAVTWSPACSTAVSLSAACSLLSSCHYSLLQYEASVQSVQQYEAGVQRAARVLSLTESCGAARCAAVRPGTGQA